jgi:hypothetical protein
MAESAVMGFCKTVTEDRISPMSNNTNAKAM